MFKFFCYTCGFIVVAMLACSFTVLWCADSERAKWADCDTVIHDGEGAVESANWWVFEGGKRGWKRIDDNICVY